jgi:hypothetical protein
VSLSNQQFHTGGFCPLSEDDWYQFELTTAGTFGITVLQATVDETVLIEVYEAVQLEVSGNANPIPIESTVTTDLTQPGSVYTGTGEAGVYYVRLRLAKPNEEIPDGWYYSIQVNLCVSICIGKQCGDDGCGGDCGACNEGEICTDGTCNLACGDANTNLSPDDAVSLFVGVEAAQTFCPWVASTYRWFTIELPGEKQCQFEILYPKGAALKALLYDASILTNPNATPLGDLSSGVSLDPTLESLFFSMYTCGLGKKFLRVEAKDSGSASLDNWVYTITAKYTD